MISSHTVKNYNLFHEGVGYSFHSLELFSKTCFRLCRPSMILDTYEGVAGTRRQMIRNTPNIWAGIIPECSSIGHR